LFNVGEVVEALVVLLETLLQQGEVEVVLTHMLR
jgi:hypothetical protein